VADKNFIKLFSNGSPECLAIIEELTKQGRDFVAISAVATDEWPVPRTELLYFTFYGYNNIRRYLLPELPASYELVAVS